MTVIMSAFGHAKFKVLCTHEGSCQLNRCHTCLTFRIWGCMHNLGVICKEVCGAIEVMKWTQCIKKSQGLSTKNPLI
jgi:hypothetical protein